MLRRVVVALVVAWLLVPSAVRAGINDPDIEIAKRHFERASSFYDAKDYRAALDEFMAAARVRPAPALDYNIARCYDRLEDYAAAIEHYRKYLAGTPQPQDLDEVQTRVAALQKRLDDANAAAAAAAAQRDYLTPNLDQPPTATPTVPALVIVDQPPKRKHTAAIVAGVIAGALVIGGAITLGILLGEPHAPPPTKSNLGPWTITR